MHKCIWGFFALLIWLLPAASGASELLRNKLFSTALGRDLPFLAYLPDGYDDADQHYPVLYLLHGAGGNETTWARLGRIKSTTDRLIAEGEIPPLVIIIPGCSRCWWVDGTKAKAETAFWSDLVPHVEQRFHVATDRASTFVAGISAGGHAAIRFALKHPGKFAAVAALSPAIYSALPPPNSAARRQPPFLSISGQFNDQAWRAQNYPSFLPSYFAQSLRVRMYLMSGDNDRLGIAYETAYFFKQLFERQPEDVELRVIDGGHHWNVWSKSIAKAMVYMLKPRLLPRVLAGQQLPTNWPDEF